MRAAWLACAFWLLGSAAWAVQLVDDGGTTVTVAKAPQRIVSLLPSLTETVCVLGACQRLVGVDRYSNDPESVRRLPQLGGGMDPNVEAVLALRPDLVLVAPSSRVAPRLRALGLVVLALEPHTLADVHRVYLQLGAVLGQEGAEAQWRALDAALGDVAQSLPAQVRSLRVYFEVGTPLFAAGTSSFIGETLARLGLHNIVPAALGPFPQLNPEFVVHANPDVIMLGQASASALQARPGWRTVRALQSGQVCAFNAAEMDVLTRPGPRMAEGARTMAQCLQRLLAAAP